MWTKYIYLCVCVCVCVRVCVCMFVECRSGFAFKHDETKEDDYGQCVGVDECVAGLDNCKFAGTLCGGVCAWWLRRAFSPPLFTARFCWPAMMRPCANVRAAYFSARLCGCL